MRKDNGMTFTLRLGTFAEQGISYEVTSELSGLLHGIAYQRQAQEQFTALAEQAQYGILEIGADSSLVTTVLAGRSLVPVHAIEPDQALRTLLLSRLLGEPESVRDRVAVHTTTLQDADMPEVADLVICANVIGTWNSTQRRSAWRAIAHALIPGGIAVLQLPLKTSRTTGRLNAQQLLNELASVGLHPQLEEYGNAHSGQLLKVYRR